MYCVVDDVDQKGTGWGRSITSSCFHFYVPNSVQAVCGFGFHRPRRLYDDIEERGGICSGKRKCTTCSRKSEEK